VFRALTDFGFCNIVNPVRIKTLPLSFTDPEGSCSYKAKSVKPLKRFKIMTTATIPMSETITYEIGNKTFVLDKKKAEEAFAAKKVINGKISPYFNILPLKYHWAYDLYKTMKANHWEPEDVLMQKDCEHWRSSHIKDIERWIIKMGIGYFSAAEGIVGDNILHVIREAVTAPELKLVLGRHAHEENIHADSLVYMISALGLNPHECEAMFEDVPSIVRKNAFVNKLSQALRKDLDFTQTANKQLLAKNIFVFGQCMEGTQFYGLFGMILSLYRQNKFPGIGQMFRYTLRDESNHIELLRNLLMDLVEENPEIWTPSFKEELRQHMAEAVRLEKEFIQDCLPLNAIGLSAEEFMQYIDYIADRRLEGVGLEALHLGVKNPFPWLAEMMDIKKEQNFFEGRVTEYQKASSLDKVSDDEL
jgi:ribonucleoside-diphosphate reductase beta chain